MNVRRFRRAEVATAPAAPVSLLMPGAGAGEWELCRAAAAGGIALLPPGPGITAATRQVFGTMEAAAANLQPAEAFVLTLPAETGIVQRLTLPAAEPDELEEMVRIQLEKILPYPVETVNLALQEIARTDTEVVVAVETVHQDRLAALCQPLVAREHWPVRVVFQALALTEIARADEEGTALIYREAGRCVLGIGEGGRLSFAQALNGQTAGDLAAELPAVLLGAELEECRPRSGRCGSTRRWRTGATRWLWRWVGPWRFSIRVRPRRRRRRTASRGTSRPLIGAPSVCGESAWRGCGNACSWGQRFTGDCWCWVFCGSAC